MMGDMSISDADSAAMVRGRKEDVTLLTSSPHGSTLLVELFGGTGSYGHTDGISSEAAGGQVCTLSLHFELDMDAKEAAILIDEWTKMDAPVTVIFDEQDGTAQIINQASRQRVASRGVTT